MPSGLRLLAVFVLPPLLSACAYFKDDEALDMKSAVLRAESYETQEALVKYYETAASDMEIRANNSRLFESQYEGKTYLYGAEAQDTLKRTQKLADIYERAAAENRKLAALHRQVAMQLPCKPAVGIPGKGSLIPCHSPFEKSASGNAP